MQFYKLGGACHENISFKSALSESDADLIKITADSLRVYLEYSMKISALAEKERSEKLALTTDYTNGLIEKGGVPANVFKKQLGIETTKKFFDSAFFGTAAK